MKIYTDIIRLAPLLTAAAFLSAAPGAGAATFDLCVGNVDLTTPDGEVIPMWGYALDTGATGCADDTPTVPGPELRTSDDFVTINLTNSLSGFGTDNVSVVIPGQNQSMTPVFFNDGTYDRVRSLTHETAPAGTQSYTWTGMKAGTFVYHSGTHMQVQVQMGLYGAVVIEPTPGEAYGVSFDAEQTLFYSEIDPALHAAVSSGNYGPTGTTTSTVYYKPKYFLINGSAYDPADTAANQALPIGAAGQTTLLRLLNMGLQDHFPSLQGMYASVIAEDGNAYTYPRQQYSIELAPSKTRDAIITVPGSASAGDLYAVTDRGLNLTNAGFWDGGMLAHLAVGAASPALVPVITTNTKLLENMMPKTVNDFANVTRKARRVKAPMSIIDVAGNDYDPDGSIDLSSVRILSVPDWGRVTNLGDGTIGFTPPRRLGTYTVTYTVNDNSGATSRVTELTINVIR